MRAGTATVTARFKLRPCSLYIVIVLPGVVAANTKHSLPLNKFIYPVSKWKKLLNSPDLAGGLRFDRKRRMPDSDMLVCAEREYNDTNNGV